MPMKTVYVRNISPGNAALEFIDARLLDDNYRGNRSSQHNRYTMDKLVTLLRTLDKYSPNFSLMPIRTTDISKRPENTAEEITYARFCGECKEAIGIGSQDAMRKNLFVDLHRMGLIQRFGIDGTPTDPFSQQRVNYVSLTRLGVSFVEANIFDRYYVFSRGVDRLLRGFIGILLDVLRDPEYDLRHVTIYEFMFFLSAVATHTSFNISRDKAVDLIKHYRTLSPTQRRAVVETLKAKLRPELFPGSKQSKRDFHNWTNKATQVFCLLEQTAYFEKRIAERQPDKLVLRFGKGMPLGESPRGLKRSLSQKYQYFSNHDVQKTLGYELHHIVPLSWSENVQQFELLDNWQNMAYIDAKSHATITQNGNRNVVMTAEGSDLVLSDYDEHSVPLKYQENLLYSVSQQNTMLKYNRELLGSND